MEFNQNIKKRCHVCGKLDEQEYCPECEDRDSKIIDYDDLETIRMYREHENEK